MALQNLQEPQPHGQHAGHAASAPAQPGRHEGQGGVRDLREATPVGRSLTGEGGVLSSEQSGVSRSRRRAEVAARESGSGPGGLGPVDDESHEARGTGLRTEGRSGGTSLRPASAASGPAAGGPGPTLRPPHAAAETGACRTPRGQAWRQEGRAEQTAEALRFRNVPPRAWAPIVVTSRGPCNAIFAPQLDCTWVPKPLPLGPLCCHVSLPPDALTHSPTPAPGLASHTLASRLHPLAWLLTTQVPLSNEWSLRPFFQRLLSQIQILHTSPSIKVTKHLLGIVNKRGH